MPGVAWLGTSRASEETACGLAPCGAAAPSQMLPEASAVSARLVGWYPVGNGKYSGVTCACAADVKSSIISSAIPRVPHRMQEWYQTGGRTSG